ncbi:metallophosphoesterase [Natronorubrum daqingense]|uniref:Phosphoesterase n=1 Tax=Natronorubrum daqingense TaxID=588898 RepID=A0A1N7DQL7_9EURY|nr:metallophosphoesterase [Natronorubrum daqingense]APX96110.1 phosphoesterase [Natronorubrum daqingense]SIR78051.1 Calcineurin-like phosphoesterase superfamily domain-containing protein [Natronorubrum daqingense]
MADNADGTVYYVISDLHIGGDEQLEHVEFLDELLAFLEELETTDEDAELLINGDAFGLWEFTQLEGIEKFDSLVSSYPQLFEQFRATGENVQITLLPGNHDYELAAYDEYVERFAEYNVDLVQEESITRTVGEREIWLEHGMQRDPNNRIEDFGNQHDKPLGYYVNRHVTSRAGQLSDRGRYNWLKDIQAVAPMQRIPTWMTSKYFYREMNPLLRYAAVPFLLLFNVSAILAILAGLDLADVWSAPIVYFESALVYLGPASTLVYSLLAVNVAVVGLLLLIGVPLYLVARDVRITLNRFGIFEGDEPADPTEPYHEAAREVFEERPQTAVFCYGHTHRPAVTELEDRLVVNTGTWLKRLYRREVVAGLLPPVFQPSFQLNYARIAAESEGVVVEYETVDKPDPIAEELTYTERLLTVGIEPELDIPNRSVVSEDAKVPEPEPAD